MLQPTRLISTPFAQEGEKTEIQNVTGEFDNSATYRLGFPPLTMQSIRLGGKPPKGTDFNGVLFDITENISFLCKGGRYQYNAGLSTLIGGYPEGSNLLLDDNVTEVVSTVAGNQNNPNIDMTGWILKPNKTTAVNVADASGETQQQVNYNGGSKWHSRVGGYKENERVVIANGDIVKSTVDGNANDPNVDMAGWVKTNSASQIFDESGKTQQEINSNSTFVVNPSPDENFKAQLQYAVSNYKSVLIRGTHEIDLSDAVAVVPVDGCSIYFDPNAKIVVKPNSLERYYLFNLNGVKDVNFWNPICVGDKHTHLGTSGQWGHCFNLENCENVNIYYPKVSEFWGDGIYVKRAKNVKIFNPQLTDNRRQGLSIVSCDGMEVFYPQFIDTSGQAPAYGIDIEPNWNGESTKGLKIYNPTFRNNGTGGSYQAGMAISTHRTHLPDGSVPIVDTVIDVEIFNPKFYSDAMLISAYNDTVKGSLIIHNPEFYDARRTALYFINHQSDNFKTIINNPKIYDAVSLGGTSIYDNPITFECTPDAVKTSNGTQNVEINNPEIYASDTAGSKRFAIRNVTPNTFPNDMRNVTINKLKAVGFTAVFSNSSGNSATTSTLDNTFKLTYSDQSVLSALSTGSSITLNMERFANIYTAGTLQGVYYLAADILINGAELYYSNLSSNNLAVLTLRFGSSSAPTQAYVEGLSPSKLTTGVVVPRGSFVRLRKLASDRWLVVAASPNIATVETSGVTASYDPPSLAAAGTAGDTVTTTVTVTGATVGDVVQAGFNRYNVAIEITASVSATNTVTVKFKNTSASAVDLPSGTITVKLV